MAATQRIERIILIGPTGAGKTTVAPLVAALLGWRWLDIDAEVAREAGMDIPAIFAAEGEQGFRRREREALAEAMAHPHVIVAKGAGIGEHEAARALIWPPDRANWVVALNVAPAIVWQRLTAEAQARQQTPGEARPMLAGDDPLGRLTTLYARRQAWYTLADETIVADDFTPDTLARRIVAGVVTRGLLPGTSKGGKPLVSMTRRVLLASADTPEAAQAPSSLSYEAVVAWGALATLGERLTALGLPERLHVVADANVAALYEPGVMAELMDAGFKPLIHRFAAGETSKSREQLNDIHDWLVERHAERGEALVALGGGVTGDLAGFAAATYLRGLPLIHIPTSLLAQVDASIGGKVAIDHPQGKNLIGAFYQPRLVVADPATLLTLPSRYYIEGWAEVIKHGVALNATYFESLERDAEALLARQPAPMTEAIARSVALKVAVVEGDEREREGGRRALLNYGHTLGHAIETITGYGQWLHGEAVSVGMVFASRLGRHIGVTPAEVCDRQEALLKRFGLPMRIDGLSAHELVRVMLLDKKARGGRLRWILPTALGQATLFSDVSEADVRATLAELGAVE